MPASMQTDDEHSDKCGGFCSKFCHAQAWPPDKVHDELKAAT